MWFLIKGTIWFSLVLVALSYLGSNNTDSQNAQMNVAGAVSAASEAYRYVSAICVEKPDVCVKGAETFHALGERAREGAKVAYELIDSHLNAADEPKVAAANTPAAKVEAVTVSDDIKTGTIKVENTIPLPQKRPAL
ncbi:MULTISPECIES: DUF5330 domain-containing protein [Agrobacterium]|uniref:DUF5330 domain-containing protein n=1 Tax=Agrobacterium larrymoorei TaxID=160699 RepID=A0AAJ2BGN9_9HYPH|nr:DUF5330 domain-containing protein [Agrobacterium larrymoorei]MDQ1185450.1 hypothetical protein [Agrobacterium larrymoorei]MDQ1197929.1 hypothetical protein [Rhizobium sp. SORGH_AS_0787]MDR6104572.1 hypothetical protein [Agrobacterium larrymoorei]